jgi:cytochrome c-type biogenesis protein CcmH/NrfG
MFFPRLRNHAKWMFVFLALVFGVGFVIFGVGSSLPSGLGDILGGTSSTGEASISDAQKEVEKNPKDPQAQLNLSRAYQRDGNIDAAIPPLAKYAKLRPRNQDVLQELAGLYTTQANKAQEVAGLANQEYQAVSGITALVSGTTQQLFQAGPLDQTILDDVSKRGQEASGKASAAFVAAAATYGKLTKLAPKNAQLWFLYGLAAESASKAPDAIKAYQQFVKLTPDAPEVPQVKARIKSLQQQ